MKATALKVQSLRCECDGPMCYTETKPIGLWHEHKCSGCGYVGWVRGQRLPQVTEYPVDVFEEPR